MNTENKILIQSLEEGYVITDCISGKKYAVESPEGVIRTISKALGIPEPEPESHEMVCKCIQQKEETAEIAKPEEMISPVPNILKQDILIPRFKYNDSLKNSILDYKNTWYAELPDGRVVLGYGGSSYYTTKENVMKIPFPVPYGYFKGSGVSTTALTCLRAYRSLLSADKILGKNDDGGSDQTLHKSLDYVSKSTQDRVKEAAEQKEAHRRKMDDCKGQTEMSEKTRKLRDMTIRMGIQ